MNGGNKIKREGFLREHVSHMRLNSRMTVNELVRQFSNSGCFGAGRLSTACDIFEKMVRDEKCTIFLAMAGAIVPAGLRAIISDVIRKKLVDVIVSTGANMIHDLIEALGGHHYKGHWLVDDSLLLGYHIYRIYDVFVPEEDFVKLDIKMADMFGEIAEENQGRTLSSRELTREIGSRLKDQDSILRVAYEANTPVFLPAIRDSEFGLIYRLHTKRQAKNKPLQVDAFKEVSEIVDIAIKSPRLGMVVIGGGTPRNTIQHAAVTAGKGLDYAIVITMDRPETGGLSGSTLEETVSWGKVKKEAAKVMVISDALIAFPLMVSAVLERMGDNFVRKTV